VIGVAAAALALLETAIGISGRIRDAYESQKHLGRVLDSHKEELTTTKTIVQTVKDENALQTASVASELVNIEAIGKRLVDLLKTLEPGNKGALRQFIHQVVQGSKDERTLAAIMAELTRSKRNLSLTRTAQDTIVANAAVVEQINTTLQKVLGEGQELWIAQLLNDRYPGRAYITVGYFKMLRSEQMMAWCYLATLISHSLSTKPFLLSGILTIF
jgi:hypothetical protein